MTRLIKILVLSGMLALFHGPASHAMDRFAIPIKPDLSSSGWKMLNFDGIPSSEFKGTRDGIMEVRSHESSSVLYAEVADDPVKASTLTWSWQVVEGLASSSNLKQVGQDDRVLALHVVFAEDDMMSILKGAISPFARGRVLTYVWGGQKMEQFPHPHLPDKAWMIVRQTEQSPLNVWIDETVDLKADYLRAFGSEPPAIAYIGISGDADDLHASCFGKIRSITLN